MTQARRSARRDVLADGASPPDPIDAYAQALGEALAFDPVGARAATDEARDHLTESAEALRRSGRPEPERSAIQRFGDVPFAAAQFAAARWPARLSGATSLAAAVAALIALAMRLRRDAIEAAMAAGLTDDAAAGTSDLVSRTAISLDRVALAAACLAALLAGLLARRASQSPTTAGIVALSVCAGALATSSLAGLVWSALAPAAAPLALIVATLATEAVALAALVLRLRGLRRHVALAKRAEKSVLN